MGNKILLTGAGFSHNFGLPLAKNVWGMIFNNPLLKRLKLTKQELLNKTNNHAN